MRYGSPSSLPQIKEGQGRQPTAVSTGGDALSDTSHSQQVAVVEMNIYRYMASGNDHGSNIVDHGSQQRRETRKKESKEKQGSLDSMDSCNDPTLIRAVTMTLRLQKVQKMIRRRMRV